MWFFVLSEFHKKRILILFHPGTDPEYIEYQQDLGIAALKSGGVFGKGLFGKPDDYITVPEIHNDFIFTYAGQVFGFIGTVGLVIILAYICLKIFGDSRVCRDHLGKFICMGAFGLILTHCIMNIGMVLKVAPVIGIPLPFLSGGGTLIRLTYNKDCVGDALISEVSRRYGVNMNILLGSLELLQGSPLGGLVVLVEGSMDARREAIRFLCEHNVIVEVIEHG